MPAAFGDQVTGTDSDPPLRFRPVDFGLLATASIVWGLAYVFIRQGLLLGAAPFVFAGVRYALGAALFAAIALARREPFPPARVLLASAAVGGVLIIGLYGGFLYWGEQYTTGGYAALLASTAPLLSVAFGFWLLSSERLGRLGVAGMLVGFAGAAVLVLPELSYSTSLSGIGPLFILGAMVSAALGTIVLRRLAVGRQGLWQIGAQFLVAAILLGILASAVPETGGLPLSMGVLGALAALVLFSTLLGYFAYFSLHHRVGPVRANVVAYLAPLVGVATGTGLYGEPLTVWELAGVAIVLGGVTLVLWESSTRERAAGH